MTAAGASAAASTLTARRTLIIQRGDTARAREKTAYGLIIEGTKVYESNWNNVFRLEEIAKNDAKQELREAASENLPDFRANARTASAALSTAMTLVKIDGTQEARELVKRMSKERPTDRQPSAPLSGDFVGEFEKLLESGA